nr:hypothetical protein [Tanacetum cinerariifolium]
FGRVARALPAGPRRQSAFWLRPPRALGYLAPRIDAGPGPAAARPRADRVHAVEVGGILAVVHDEELRAAGIFAGVGHAQHAPVVVLVVAAGFALDFVAGAAGAGLAFGAGLGVGVAALNHKIRDDAVKFGAVIEAFAGQVKEVLNGIRRVLLVELNFHDALGRVDFGSFHAGGGITKNKPATMLARQR